MHFLHKLLFVSPRYLWIAECQCATLGVWYDQCSLCTNEVCCWIRKNRKEYANCYI